MMCAVCTAQRMPSIPPDHSDAMLNPQRKARHYLCGDIAPKRTVNHRGRTGGVNLRSRNFFFHSPTGLCRGSKHRRSCSKAASRHIHGCMRVGQIRAEEWGGTHGQHLRHPFFHQVMSLGTATIGERACLRRKTPCSLLSNSV